MLTKVADGLPGFGIVAAVLGIVITMGSIGGDIVEVGGHVAGALVGTFLGILLGYGFVGPMAAAMEARAEQDSRIYESVKTALLACLRGYNPKIALELPARRCRRTCARPSPIRAAPEDGQVSHGREQAHRHRPPGQEGRPRAHHGGSWKVAYADFVTAMMAFFLVLWLMATTNKNDRAAIPSTSATPAR